MLKEISKMEYVAVVNKLLTENMKSQYDEEKRITTWVDPEGFILARRAFCPDMGSYKYYINIEEVDSPKKKKKRVFGFK